MKHFPELPGLPEEFGIPPTRDPDMLDFLHYIFGFQVRSPDDMVCELLHSVILGVQIVEVTFNSFLLI